jgi:hypothetical protein
MTPDDLRRIGARIYGANWQAPISRALGVNLRTLQRWVNGQNPIPPHIEADLRQLLAIAGRDPE